MAESEEVPAPGVINNATTVSIPKWVIATASTVGGAFIALMVAAVWSLLGGGVAGYVDGRADVRIAADQLLDTGSTVRAAISELTLAVGGLTIAIGAQETINTEFRENTSAQLQAINGAILQLAAPRPTSG